MSPAGMIVVDVSAQHSPEVSLVEDDHVIETLAPNASNDPFDVGALPRERGAVGTCSMSSPATRRLKYGP